MLRADGLSYAWEGTDRWAVRNVSLQAGDGECLGVVGGPGAGKSTLAYLLGGLLEPGGGGVTIDGGPVPGENSTVLQVIGNEIEVLREGLGPVDGVLG